MDNFRKACSEVCQILELVDVTYINSIPEKLMNFLIENKDDNYIKEINPEDSLENQNLLQETIDLLALIKLSYWCKDEEEKKHFEKFLLKNEEKHKKAINEKYNPDNIFNPKHQQLEENHTKENLQLVEYKKQSIWSKILSKIKNFFKV